MKIKSLMLAAMMGFTFTAKAHVTKNNLKTVTNPELQSLLKEGQSWAHLKGDTSVVEALKVAEIKPAQKPDESTEQAFTRVLKAHLHQAYPITGNDGGYSFEAMNGQNEHQLKIKMDDWFLDDEEDLKESIDRILALLLPISQSKDLVVLYGSGSGNNTHAGIVAVLDLNNKEIVYLMVSNFGSDN